LSTFKKVLYLTSIMSSHSTTKISTLNSNILSQTQYVFPYNSHLLSMNAHNTEKYAFVPEIYGNLHNLKEYEELFPFGTNSIEEFLKFKKSIAFRHCFFFFIHAYILQLLRLLTWKGRFFFEKLLFSQSRFHLPHICKRLNWESNRMGKKVEI